MHFEDDKERRSYLRDEYLLLQNQYEDYDKRSLTIKGWVSTAATAGLALSFNQDQKFTILVPIFVAVISIVFWYLEAQWKLFQYAIGDRVRVIEAHFRGETEIFIKDPAPFQVYNSWANSYSKDTPLYQWEKDGGYRPKPKWKRIANVAKAQFVCLPYAVIVILSAVTFALLCHSRLI